MKTYMKRFFSLLLTVLLLCSLSGCKALDEMRENQAYYTENGDILWKGSTYKKLPTSEELWPEFDGEISIYVTESDVPVLLSQTHCLSSYSPSTDGRFLMEDNHIEDIFYCEASIYEDICTRIRAPFVPEIVCYSYDVPTEDVYEWDTAVYTLTQEQVEVITTVVENTEPTVMGDGMALDCLWTLYLEECSQDRLFRRNTMDISYTGSTYYLHLYTDQEELLFTVPSGCNAQFDQITAAQRKSYEAWDNYWETDDFYGDDI